MARSLRDPGKRECHGGVATRLLQRIAPLATVQCVPCYLFTYHGHGTWMPDHPRGYVHRKHGLQPPDPHMAEHYRFRQTTDAVLFTGAAQRLMMKIARDAGPHIAAIVHGVAAEPTHIHVLVSWKHARTGKSMRASIRSALSRRLNAELGNRGREGWFSDSPSRKRVRDHEHCDYLLLEYLPGHGRSWIREEDATAAEDRDAQREVSVRVRKKRRTRAARREQ